MLTDNPIIFTKNYVNEDDTFTFSSGAASERYLFDWDKASVWESVGSDDTVTETVAVRFFEGAQAVQRTFDSILLLNHNLKDFDVQHSNDGISWTTIPTISWPTARSATDSFFDLRVAEGGPGDRKSVRVGK